MKIKNKFYHFIVSIVLVVSLLAGTIVPANTIVKAMITIQQYGHPMSRAMVLLQYIIMEQE